MRRVMFALVVGLSSVPTRADDEPQAWNFTGRAEPSVTATLRARVDGCVEQISFHEGDAVREGDLLVVIDRREYSLELDAARARLKAAEAKLEVVHLKVADHQKLAEQRVLGQRELAASTAELAEAEAHLMLARVEVQQAELKLSWTQIKAPVSGRVSRQFVSVGELVTLGQTQLLGLMATDPVEIVFEVPESLCAQWRRDGRGTPDLLQVAFQFPGEEGFPHVAKLQRISPLVNARTQTVRFTALAANPDDLIWPGTTTSVRVSRVAK
jgi:RND family efflux transporter MFP subunit